LDVFIVAEISAHLRRCLQPRSVPVQIRADAASPPQPDVLQLREVGGREDGQRGAAS
jgi:hypothetical protein